MPPHPTAGQASAEYVAALMLVAIVLAGAGTAVAAPDLAGSVGKALRRGLCVVTGGVCSPGEARALGMKPCPVHVRDNTEKLEAKVLLATLGRGDGPVIERRPDRTASVDSAGESGNAHDARQGRQRKVVEGQPPQPAKTGRCHHPGP